MKFFCVLVANIQFEGYHNLHDSIPACENLTLDSIQYIFSRYTVTVKLMLYWALFIIFLFVAAEEAGYLVSG